MRPPRNYFVRAFRRDAGMLSRVADSMYWMSRYLERAEHTARLVDVELQLWLDQSPETGAFGYIFLVKPGEPSGLCQARKPIVRLRSEPTQKPLLPWAWLWK